MPMSGFKTCSDASCVNPLVDYTIDKEKLIYDTNCSNIAHYSYDIKWYV